MKQKSLFGSIAGAMLLGVMSLTSCVESDLYDDFYDDDLSSEQTIARRKFKNENGGDWGEAEQNYAEMWIQCNSWIEGECVAATIDIVRGNGESSRPCSRAAAGEGFFGDRWQVPYVRSVQEGGLPGSSTAKSVIMANTGLSDHTSDWSTYKTQHMNNAGTEVSIDRLIVVQVGGQHWGRLTRYYKYGNSWASEVTNSHKTVTVLNSITCALW